MLGQIEYTSADNPVTSSRQSSAAQTCLRAFLLQHGAPLPKFIYVVKKGGSRPANPTMGDKGLVGIFEELILSGKDDWEGLGGMDDYWELSG